MVPYTPSTKTFKYLKTLQIYQVFKIVFLKVNFLIFRNQDIQHTTNLKALTKKYRDNKLKVIALFPKTVKYQVYLNSHSILSDPKLILRTIYLTCKLLPSSLVAQATSDFCSIP